jgi:hypothetical protein
VAAPPGPSLETGLRNSRIIHGALVFSLLVYAFLVHVILGGDFRAGMRESQVGVIRLAFYALAGALALAAVTFRYRITLFQAAPPLLAVQQRMVVCMALVEAIAILAMVLALLSGSIRDFYVLWAPALALQLFFAPTREVWEDAARAGGRRSR